MEKPFAIWAGVALRCDSLCQNLAESSFSAILAYAQSVCRHAHITGDLTVRSEIQPPRPLQ